MRHCHMREHDFISFTDFVPTIPKLYWDIPSQEQRIKGLFDLLHKLACYCDKVGLQVKLNRQDIDWLLDEFEKFKESGFDDYYRAQIEEWISNNLDALFAKYSRGVYFGLTLEGYFSAMVPDSWNEIVFDTGAQYGLEDYGRLILRYDVDSPYTVEQPIYHAGKTLMERINTIELTANNALSLAQTNEQDIALNDADIAFIKGNTGVSTEELADLSHEERITALETV